MGTSKPKIQGYIDQEVFNKFEAWYKERNIRNISNALEVLIRDYFDIEANNLIARLERLELKFEVLAGQSTINPKVDNPITSTNDLKVDYQSTSSLKVDNQIKSTNEALVDNQKSTFNPKLDYVNLKKQDIMGLYDLTLDQFKKRSATGWFKSQGWVPTMKGRTMFFTKLADKI
jgi:hypothetical protein